jgi:tRNA(Ile)-lysidine synthase
MRPRAVAPGTGIKLLRPLLGWRRAELEQICIDAGITPVRDPANIDDRYERVRVRSALAEAEWLDPAAIARSASNLADADKALDWAVRLEWDQRVKERRGTILYHPAGAPREILRRVVSRAVRKLATEGESELRGPELSRLVGKLADGGTATLRGVLCRGGAEWQFVPSPNRTRPVDNLE